MEGGSKRSNMNDELTSGALVLASGSGRSASCEWTCQAQLWMVDMVCSVQGGPCNSAVLPEAQDVTLPSAQSPLLGRSN